MPRAFARREASLRRADLPIPGSPRMIRPSAPPQLREQKLDRVNLAIATDQKADIGGHAAPSHRLQHCQRPIWL